MAEKDEIEQLIDDFAKANPRFRSLLEQGNISTNDLIASLVGEVDSRGQAKGRLQVKLRRNTNAKGLKAFRSGFKKLRSAVKNPELTEGIITKEKLQTQRVRNERLFNQSIEEIIQGKDVFGDNVLEEETTAALQEGLTTTPEQQQLRELATQRFSEALEGTLPVNPAVRRELETAEQNLRAKLRRQLGTGFETSSAGIEALQRFEETKQGVLGTERRRDLQLFGSIASQLESEELSRAQLGETVEQLGEADELGRLQQVATLEQLVQGRISDETRNRIAELQAETQENVAQIAAHARAKAAASAASARLGAAKIKQETSLARLAEQGRQFNKNFGLQAAKQKSDIGFRERAFDLAQSESEFNRNLQSGQFALGAQEQFFGQQLQASQFEINKLLAEEQLQSSDLNQLERLANFGNIGIPGLSEGVEQGTGVLDAFQNQRRIELSGNIAQAQADSQFISDIFSLVGVGTGIAAGGA